MGGLQCSECGCFDSKKFLKQFQEGNTNRYEKIISFQQTKKNIKSEDFTKKFSHQSLMASYVNKIPNLGIKLSTSQFQQILIITPQGLINSQRNKKDGQTYFGNTDQCDYKLISQYQNQGIFFKISFVPAMTFYIIQDLGFGLGTFVKKNTIYLRDNMLLNIGNIFIQINFTQKEFNYQQKNSKIILLKLWGGDCKGRSASFSQTFILGRSKECSLCISDYMISKEHCIFEQIEGQWICKDLNSRNGTWLYISQPITITEKMIVKNNNISMQFFDLIP